ncbi:low temperature requirement protein A [Nonomuraea rubra]
MWWMFSAFGWLANAVRPDRARVRLLLVLAMTAFFVMGLDVPYAFEPEGWAFPAAYLAVVAIHWPCEPLVAGQRHGDLPHRARVLPRHAEKRTGR